MSGLDIEALRLTSDEASRTASEWEGSGVYPASHAVRDAQLGKALWGVLDWLMDFNSDYNAPVGDSVTEFTNSLEQANIKRPT